MGHDLRTMDHDLRTADYDSQNADYDFRTADHDFHLHTININREKTFPRNIEPPRKVPSSSLHYNVKAYWHAALSWE